ncbi:Acyl-homoserine lactone acylase QuiP [Streptomyces sp. RB5]|uniref:Acyl-homoserine lactone acylase QuiP n=1 Tax=Streptomyces smaragdinus TaxID=2585196 RepID=A0A7K0CNX8_9ACTN|nr:penicillin acylase family protein [Streptomyces smaragdinus]MQY15190.1 Acyl-homoserine lactone acylase QuiP [Streptomyces smaragdinus]
MPGNENSSSPRQPRAKKRTKLMVLGVAFLLVLGLGAGAYWAVGQVHDSYPQTSGELKLPGLSRPVDVKRDARGVPQLYASTPEDLFRAQGFVHAQDRFWEMDVRRHTTSGTLSEMFGKSQFDTDAFLRTLDWRGVAQKEFDTKLSDTTKAYLRAYTSGVNEYLKTHSGSSLSVEYAALGLTNDYKPALWTPVDSVAWLKAMAWDLRANMEDEIDRSLMTTRFTPDQMADLYPPYPYERNRPIVDAGTVKNDVYTPKGGGDIVTKDVATANAATSGAEVQTQLSALSENISRVPALLGPSGSGIGSNSWVVSGANTTTGKPLLANDPHLAPQLPSLWYQMGLHCRTVDEKCPFDVSGFTFSGLPGVVIGHNQSISWGFTNLGADVADLYLEKVDSSGRYELDGKAKDFKTRTETLKSADGAKKTITVRSTENGPIVSDRMDSLEDVGKRAPVSASAPDRGDGYAVALRWTALDPSNTMDAVFEIDTAQDFQQFRAAAADFAVPSQNLIYADTAGNIGYQAPGQIPVRGAKADGSMPLPGWNSAYKWQGYIKQSALPWEFNPKRGFIVTANQAVIDEKAYPYLLTTDPGYGARSQRINNLIKDKIKDGGKISPADMASIQIDNNSEIGALLTPMLLKIPVKDPYVREAQDLLKDWDYSQDADSAAAAYFNAVWRNILLLAFGEKMPKELRVEGECLRVPTATQSDAPETTVVECGDREPTAAQPDGGDRWFEVVRKLVDKPDSKWWVTPNSRAHSKDGTQTRDELFERAMRDARWELTAKLGKDIDTWNWGRLHRLMLKNQTLGTEGPGFIQWLLNRGPWNLSGGESTVNATGWNAAGGYDVSWVPSMRMVVDLDNLDESQWVNLTGASGHARDEHYVDQTDAWAKGELFPWPSTPQAVEKAAEDKLTLTP